MKITMKKFCEKLDRQRSVLVYGGRLHGFDEEKAAKVELAVNTANGSRVYEDRYGVCKGGKDLIFVKRNGEESRFYYEPNCEYYESETGTGIGTGTGTGIEP